MADEYLSSDFNYKKYSLEQLDNWVNDALNCEDLTPQDIYDTVIKCVDDSIEYHKKYLTKSIELLSLMKGHRPNVFDASAHEFDDFWYGEQYTEEEMDAMCERAATENDKDKCREYNLREAEYYAKRAELDAQHSEHWSNPGRNKTYDQMIEEGWQMTDDGFWIKENDKGTMSVSN
jgi:hypothetical protein